MAIRITKVYTRTGDTGSTRLVGGKPVAKDAARIEAYGAIDELNSVIGLARVFNDDLVSTSAAAKRLDKIFRRLQNELFDLGSELATPPDVSYEGMFRVGSREVRRLERLIDTCQADLEPLNSFILPGGGKVGGFLHQARTVCRRAERDTLRLSRQEEIGTWTLRYVNRLSDLLFVLSRWVSRKLNEPEYLWERGLRAGEQKAATATKRPRAKKMSAKKTGTRRTAAPRSRSWNNPEK